MPLSDIAVRTLKPHSLERRAGQRGLPASRSSLDLIHSVIDAHRGILGNPTEISLLSINFKLGACEQPDKANQEELLQDPSH
jgi:hypothetical protein